MSFEGGLTIAYIFPYLHRMPFDDGYTYNICFALPTNADICPLIVASPIAYDFSNWYIPRHRSIEHW